MRDVKTPKKNVWSPIIVIVLILVTILTLTKQHDLDVMLRTLSEMNHSYLLLGFSLMFLFVFCESAALFQMLCFLGYKTKRMVCLKYALIGFYYAGITPSSSGGQPAQIYFMKKDGIEIGDSTFILAVFSLSYHISMVLLTIMALLTRFRFLSAQLGFIRYFTIYGSMVNFSIITFILVASYRTAFAKRIVDFLLRFLSRFHWVKEPVELRNNLYEEFDRFHQGFIHLQKKPKEFLKTLSFVLLQIISRLSVSVVVYRALQLSGTSNWSILSLGVMTALSFESLPSPGAIGFAEASIVRVNQHIFGESHVFTAALLIRGITFYSLFIVSGFLTFIFYWRLSRKKANEETRNY